MKSIRFLDTVEHRFTHDEDTPPRPLNDIAVRDARAASFGIDQTNGKGGSLWKVPAGGEMSVPEADGDRLIELGLAEMMGAGPERAA